MTNRDVIADILRKQRPGQQLSLRTRIRLRAWQRRKRREYLASLGHQPPPITSGLYRLVFKILVSYAVAGIVLWLATPCVGFGFGLLLAMLAWIVMGALWLS